MSSGIGKFISSFIGEENTKALKAILLDDSALKVDNFANKHTEFTEDGSVISQDRRARLASPAVVLEGNKQRM